VTLVGGEVRKVAEVEADGFVWFRRPDQGMYADTLREIGELVDPTTPLTEAAPAAPDNQGTPLNAVANEDDFVPF
jgi:hypothetical protein